MEPFTRGLDGTVRNRQLLLSKGAQGKAFETKKASPPSTVLRGWMMVRFTASSGLLRTRSSAGNSQGAPAMLKL